MMAVKSATLLFANISDGRMSSVKDSVISSISAYETLAKGLQDNIVQSST